MGLGGIYLLPVMVRIPMMVALPPVNKISCFFVFFFEKIAESCIDLAHLMFINVFLNIWPEDLRELHNKVGSLSGFQDLSWQHFDCDMTL